MTTSRGLVSPSVDAFCAGGASLAALAIFSFIAPAAAGPAMLKAFVVLSVALNWPHFMASYHLLYSTPGATRLHPFATIYVPVFLAAYAVAAAALYGRAPVFLRLLHSAAAVYLAWHYTGQAWGTMASFAHAEGLRFDDAARRLVRANMGFLLVWHAVWAGHLAASYIGAARFEMLYQAASAAALASSALGALGLLRLRRASGRLPLCVVLPWAAIHVWYALLYRFPGQLYWIQLVQLSHAAQYLPFPLLVQANREDRLGRAPAPAPAAAYYALLAAAGYIAFRVLPDAAGRLSAWTGFFPAGKAGLAGLILTDALVIHHYFVDGCIWKLGNRDVRRDLFMRLERPAPAPAPMS